MPDEQAQRTSRICAISCSKLQDDIAQTLLEVSNLDLLDLSYYLTISKALLGVFRLSQYSPGPTLLREVYLRACRRIDSYALAFLTERCPYCASLYIDGNPQIDMIAILVGRHIPGLQILSIRGCRQICTREFQEWHARNVLACKTIM